MNVSAGTGASASAASWASTSSPCRAPVNGAGAPGLALVQVDHEQPEGPVAMPMFFLELLAHQA